MTMSRGMTEAVARLWTRCVEVLVLLAGLLLVPARPATGQDRGLTLWVTLGDSDQLVEVDPYTYGEIRRITVDPRPHGLAVSADGGTVYLASDKTGNFQVIDVRTGRITAQINIGNDPNQMTLTRDGKFAYVPIRGDSKIAVVQLDPLKLVKLLPSPPGPHDAYTSADGSRIYVGAQYGHAISVIDPATQSVLHTIPTEDGVRPLEPSALRGGRSGGKKGDSAGRAGNLARGRAATLQVYLDPRAPAGQQRHRAMDL
jgi:YVTN family beta-propeller protein